MIDTSSDFRQQALLAKISRLDAVLYTHPHADHVQGIDELRCFNFVQKERIPVYGNLWTKRELLSRFPYVFADTTPEGGGIPRLDFHLIHSKQESFSLPGVKPKIIPLSLKHGSQETLGYRIGPMAYATDCHEIPETALQRMKGISILILDCVRVTPHKTHFNLGQALEVAAHLKPKRTYLTHLGHEMDYSVWVKKLPKGVAFAYDGLTIRGPLEVLEEG